MAPFSPASQPLPNPGELLRTADLRQWSTNPSRLVQSWVREERIRFFGPGIWIVLAPGGGDPPAPSLEQWVQALLKEDRFVVTGPIKWNTLNLSITFDHRPSGFPRAMVYNRKRTGVFRFGEEDVLFSRRSFPAKPTREWYLVDLMDHGRDCGYGWDNSLEDGVWWALRRTQLDVENLKEAAKAHGNQNTRNKIASIVASLDGPMRKRVVHKTISNTLVAWEKTTQDQRSFLEPPAAGLTLRSK